jgi:GNAT superfamily N-acetyltransferase
MNLTPYDIDFTNLRVSVFSGTEDVGSCDFREDDLDPLGVDNFIRNKALAYQHYRLCVIYIIACGGAILGFFTVSMGVIDAKKLTEGEQVETASNLRSYPGLLLGYMGVDRRYRKKGLGKWICDYCIGLAIEWSDKIGCGYVFLETSENKKQFYEKVGFITSGKVNSNGKMWMYRRIYQRTFKRSVSDYTAVGDHVDVGVFRMT